MVYTGFVNSEQGPVKIESTDEGITAIAFLNADEAELYNSLGSEAYARKYSCANAVTDEGCRQLKAYFDGRLQEFDLPLTPKGTVFQNQVWQALPVSYTHLRAHETR